MMEFTKIEYNREEKKIMDELEENNQTFITEYIKSLKVKINALENTVLIADKIIKKKNKGE
jgi:hypothetical protein